MTINTYRGVQALRFISALVVVAFHACYWFNRDSGSSGAAPEIKLIGDLCVWTFFLISGFVVVHVVDSGREPDWSTFALRRAIRILPLAWIMTGIKVAAALLAPRAMFDGDITPTRIIASLLLVPSRDSSGDFRALWGVEWTLIFEAAFYLLVTLAIAVRVDPLRLVTPVLIVVAVLSIWRPEGGSVLWFYADPVVLFLAAGMWIGRAARTGRIRPAVLATLLCTALYGVIEMVRQESSPVLAVVVFGALTASFGLLIASERRLGGRIPTWLVIAGNSAFALYLTHPLVAQALPRLMGASGVTEIHWAPVVLISVVVSVVLGWAVHRWVDTPMGRFLRRRLIGHRPVADQATSKQDSPAIRGSGSR
ncbi:acyltransferase family protein [Curtobacterium sp. VKM Ac-2884]|uniref:acyltransferase family protein n=1 Tax=Curtobacterium sp. VKM Ac-2884 TaxID=2783818 RepID=UPI00188A0C48|nr:acyltransferase [Curtobacterium sp. VKM Ac-2884]MBF4605095.1 acyltransferase [Curtobacterium sp. VKM Ac-2884]